MASRRKKRKAPQGLRNKRKPRAKRPARPAPRKKRAKPAAPRKPARKSPDWRSPTARRAILSALRAVAGSLADRLARAPLSGPEAIYLRGIANLKAGKRLTYNQALAVLSATRGGSPVLPSVFGKRERKLAGAFLERMNALALKRLHVKDTGMLVRLGMAEFQGKKIWYDPARGARQRWSIDGFRRFMTNPIYKARRSKIFKGGTFWLATPDHLGDLPKRGRTRLKFT